MNETINKDTHKNVLYITNKEKKLKKMSTKSTKSHKKNEKTSKKYVKSLLFLLDFDLFQI
jgi:hypothetical protein